MSPTATAAKPTLSGQSQLADICMYRATMRFEKPINAARRWRSQSTIKASPPRNSTPPSVLIAAPMPTPRFSCRIIPTATRMIPITTAADHSMSVDLGFRSTMGDLERLSSDEDMCDLLRLQTELPATFSDNIHVATLSFNLMTRQGTEINVLRPLHNRFRGYGEDFSRSLNSYRDMSTHCQLEPCSGIVTRQSLSIWRRNYATK